MTPEVPSDLLPNVTFFGDSSSKDKEFMVAGGFAVAGSEVDSINAEIEAIRSEAGMTSEFHWSNYRGGTRKEKAYKKLADLGFDLTRKEPVRGAFHVIIAKFGGYNHRREGGQNRDTSVNRMYYQLCLHRLAKYYGHGRQIHIRLDAGNDCEDIVRMRNQLCADAYAKFGQRSDASKCRPNCIRSILAMDSKSSNIIQLADVILGGIAAKRNGVQHTSPKGELADYILEASGHHDWAKDSRWQDRMMTVWNHESRGTPQPISRG